MLGCAQSHGRSWGVTGGEGPRGPGHAPDCPPVRVKQGITSFICARGLGKELPSTGRFAFVVQDTEWLKRVGLSKDKTLDPERP